MPDKPNFVLVPDPEPAPEPRRPGSASGSPFGRLKALAGAAGAGGALAGGALAGGAGVLAGLRNALSIAPEPLPPAPPVSAGLRPRLVFGFDATASREPAWAAARNVTDALVRVLPGELDIALAVHGGSRLHTFTPFTSNAATLRDRAASIECIAGFTQMLPLLTRTLAEPGVRVVTYIGDVFEESLSRGRNIADEMGRRGIRLFVLHDIADWQARRDAEVFADLARRTGGCVLPFDASAPDRLRDLLSAVAVYAVGGTALLEQKRRSLPGADLLLEHLRPEPRA